MLTIQRHSQKFQVRACALVTHEGWVLLHRTRGDAFWTLPGGRVELGEDSAATVTREMQEELGVQIACKGLAFLAETFFEHLGECVHEIAFIHFCELERSSPHLKKDVPHMGIESGRSLEFRWFRERELPVLPVFPTLLRGERFSIGPFPRHHVERGEVGVVAHSG